MKLLNIFMIMCMSLFITQARSQSVTNWGNSVYGAELSINLTNDVIAIGSTTSLQCSVRNTSTNDVFFIYTNPSYDFQISLISNTGKTYKLSPDNRSQAFFSTFPYKLTSKTYECSLPLKVGKNIKSGDYKLKVELAIYVNVDKSGKAPKLASYKHSLVSNLLEVQVK